MSLNNTTVRSKVETLLAITRAMVEAVRDAGSIPSGHLYAAMMPTGISLERYNYIEGMVVESGLVAKRGQLLVWVGPAGIPAKAGPIETAARAGGVHALTGFDGGDGIG